MRDGNCIGRIRVLQKPNGSKASKKEPRASCFHFLEAHFVFLLMDTVETGAIFGFIVASFVYRTGARWQIQNLSNTTASGVRGQPVVNVWHLRSQTENKSAARPPVRNSVRFDRQTGVNWVPLWLLERPMLAHLLAQQMYSLPPWKILLQF